MLSRKKAPKILFSQIAKIPLKKIIPPMSQARKFTFTWGCARTRGNSQIHQPSSMKKISAMLLLLSTFVPSYAAGAKSPVDYVDSFIGSQGARWFVFTPAALPSGPLNWRR